MKILVINSGSSSIKFQLLDMANEKVLCKGLLERIGIDNSIFNYESDNDISIKETKDIENHKVGIEIILDTIVDKEKGVIKDINEISAVGHRIVHGGEKIKKSELLTDEMIKLVEDCIDLAPLHNPANLMGISAVKEILPNVPHVGVFDTAFHSTMPEEAYVYGLDFEYYEKHGIRRFGFHGPSHQYVSKRGAEILGIDNDKFNCVTCHMGNGVSLVAIKGGKSVDTSLGYGTMCGVPMGTRAGDVDPAIMLHLIDELKMSVDEVHELIYKKSGLKGISGLTNDLRDILGAVKEGNHRAELAVKIFTRAVRKYILALSASLEGRIDAVIFTAGIGENSIDVREMICDGLEIIGAKIDKNKNDFRSEERIISTDDSKVKIIVVPTNEELMIALETEKIAKAL